MRHRRHGIPTCQAKPLPSYYGLRNQSNFLHCKIYQHSSCIPGRRMNKFLLRQHRTDQNSKYDLGSEREEKQDRQIFVININMVETPTPRKRSWKTKVNNLKQLAPRQRNEERAEKENQKKKIPSLMHLTSNITKFSFISSFISLKCPFLLSMTKHPPDTGSRSSCS